ncbi:MAG: sensor histidine kinase [Candidatus Heimdallarchaeaceae archaeon]
MSDVFSDILSQTPNLIERFGHVAKTGNSTNFELFFSPLEKWFDISAYSPKRDYFATIIEDITERKMIDKEKEKGMKEKSFILDVLAHDLRNYQVVANGFIELFIQQNAEIFKSEINSLEKAKASIVQANSLLENLSIMMKNELDTPISLKTTNIYNAIKKAEVTLKELYPKKDIIIDFSCSNDQIDIQADNLIDHLLLNILSNAVRNTDGEEAKINIKLEKTTGNKCTISIADYGKGINPNTRDTIFERFNEIGRNSGGTGLGLFIVKTLVDRYNANIWVTSRIEDDYKKGTVFNIEFDLD